MNGPWPRRRDGALPARRCPGLLCRAAGAATFVGMLAAGAPAHGQASDPYTLRQIINQKNAEAAAATWAGHAALPPASPLPSGGSGAAPSGGSANSGPSGGGFAGAAGGSGGDAEAARVDRGPMRAGTEERRPVQIAGRRGATPAANVAAAASEGNEVFLPEGFPDTAPEQAVVSYTNGMLRIRAEDASLNQILRQIAKMTGMVIRGGVAEDRVFGQYGPGRPAAVLSSLLAGSGSNLILRQGPRETITEMVLSPRNGGAMPPGPGDQRFDSKDDMKSAAMGPLPSALENRALAKR